MKNIAAVLDRLVKDADGIPCLVLNSEKREGKNGIFVTGRLRDSSGEIAFKIWSDEVLQDMASTGSLLMLTSTKVDEYQGTMQVTVNAAAPLSMQLAMQHRLIPVSPVDDESLAKMLDAVLTAIRTDGRNGFEKVDQVVDWLRGRGVWDKFLHNPAAIKHHQAYVRGLFEHSLNVARISGKILQVYETHPYAAGINKGLLLTGAFFHDIGKCIEYSITPAGLADDVTLGGGLEGHLISGTELLTEVYKHILSYEDLTKLRHIILSHHGKKEWGAVVEPKTIEAYIVHQADMMDSGFERYTAPGRDQGLWRSTVAGPVLSPKY